MPRSGPGRAPVIARRTLRDEAGEGVLVPQGERELAGHLEGSGRVQCGKIAPLGGRFGQEGRGPEGSPRLLRLRERGAQQPDRCPIHGVVPLGDVLSLGHIDAGKLQQLAEALHDLASLGKLRERRQVDPLGVCGIGGGQSEVLGGGGRAQEGVRQPVRIPRFTGGGHHTLEVRARTEEIALEVLCVGGGLCGLRAVQRGRFLRHGARVCALEFGGGVLAGGGRDEGARLTEVGDQVRIPLHQGLGAVQPAGRLGEGTHHHLRLREPQKDGTKTLGLLSAVHLGSLAVLRERGHELALPEQEGGPGGEHHAAPGTRLQGVRGDLDQPRERGLRRGPVLHGLRELADVQLVHALVIGEAPEGVLSAHTSALAVDGGHTLLQPGKRSGVVATQLPLVTGDDSDPRAGVVGGEGVRDRGGDPLRLRKECTPARIPRVDQRGEALQNVPHLDGGRAEQ